MWGKLDSSTCRYACRQSSSRTGSQFVRTDCTVGMNNPSVVIRIETHNLQEYLAFTLKKKTLLRSKQNFKQITVTKMSGY